MKCLICKDEIEDPEENKNFPFCSEHCKMVDLYSWLSEEYFISEPLPNVEDDSDKPEKFWTN